MSLKLIPPGRRKGNRDYLARGRVAGRLYEFTTETTDPITAERVAAEFVAKLLRDGRPIDPKPAPKEKTFREAAAAYEAWASPDKEDLARIRRLTADELGAKALREITNADLVAAADRLYPVIRYKASSRNRKVITPASSILHYAAEQGWCPYLRIRRFEENKPVTRALRKEPAEDLLKAAKTRKLTEEWAFLTFLFFQGMRVSDALAVAIERLDLKRDRIEVRIGKTDQWRWKALHPRAAAALKAVVGKRSSGAVFSWRNRWAVYKALKPVLSGTGIRFTPHMARHSLGTWLAGEGVSLKTRMTIMDHSDPKSNIRYEMSDIPEQAAALRLVGKRKKR